jgi:two-component system, cell cycle response regulator
VPADATLAAVAEQLRRMLRQTDVRCRLGGDEFLVILPDTPIEDALRVADSVRCAIQSLEIPSVRGKITLTASLGVAASAAAAPFDVPAFIDRADVALYRAKQDGRNAVRGCSSPGGRATSTLRLAAARPA